MFEILGFVAAFFTTASFLPQAIKTIKTRDTSGISLVMYSMFSFGVLLWFVYGIFLKDIAITLANFITLMFAVIILSFKIKNISKDGN